MSEHGFFAIIISISFIFALIITGVQYLWNLPTTSTEETLIEVATDAKTRNLESYMTDKKDWWGNNIKMVRMIDEKAAIYQAISFGKDGLENTSDDIVVNKANLNWSRMIGTGIGESIKEIGKGFVDGLKNKTIFKEEENE